MSQSPAQSAAKQPDSDVSHASVAHGAVPWQLETDHLQLKHLYAQRDEQTEQLAALQRAGANQKSITIVENQINTLNQDIRRVEEQATLHARQTEIRRVEA
jgi:flagellar biosynthesis chaperone FliJ